MKNIGVVGLGNMGMGMAKNLIAAEFPVTAYDMSNEKLTDCDGCGRPPDERRSGW
jgi:3-hydroxyisobutyrate dehydrogenase-like beta-hydroxyacid dehydrogenase